MGLFSRLFGERWNYSRVGEYELVNDVGSFLEQNRSVSVGELYESQPHLRIVVSFIARNIAQLGLHLYRHEGSAKVRVRDGIGVDVFKSPDNPRTDYGMMYALVANLALYDVAYFWVTESLELGKKLVEILPSWVVKEHGGAFSRPAVEVRFPGSLDTKILPADEVIRIAGWSPDTVRGVCSPVEALRDTLKEQIEAVAYRQQVWARGGRVSSVITRPVGAPKMSAEALKRFQEDWRNNWAGSGAKAGGTPILEEGMELKQSGFSPRESEWVDVAKLSLSTVAAAFHVNPTMIGVLDNANYSNVREFRKQLYGDSLGPTLKQITAAFNQYLLPALGLDNHEYFYEFNVAAQLQSTPEEQAQVFSSSVGGPWLTRNEVRAMQNLPAIDGGDELIVPLNVIAGGQASPRDSAPPKTGEPLVKAGVHGVRVKSPSKVSEADQEDMASVLRDFFARQEKSIVSNVGAGKDWWQQERWEKELAADFSVPVRTLASRVAHDVLDEIGEEEYDEDRTEGYLTAVCESRSRWINNVTHKRLEDALADADGSLTDAVKQAFEEMSEVRALSAGGALAACVSSFATQEVARQSGRKAVKRWIVTSSNPRQSHAGMNGEEVPLDENFSNGMKWPGDPEGGADEVAGCMCGLEIEVM